VQKDRCHNPHRRNQEMTSYYLNFRANETSKLNTTRSQTQTAFGDKINQNLNAFRQIRHRNRSPALGRSETEVKENCESEGEEMARDIGTYIVEMSRGSHEVEETLERKQREYATRFICEGR